VGPPLQRAEIEFGAVLGEVRYSVVTHDTAEAKKFGRIHSNRFFIRLSRTSHLRRRESCSGRRNHDERSRKR
jgi:hypothetical protein